MIVHVLLVFSILVIGIQSFLVSRSFIQTLGVGQSASRGLRAPSLIATNAWGSNTVDGVSKKMKDYISPALIGQLMVAKDRGDMDKFVNIHLKAIAETTPRELPGTLIALLAGVVDKIDHKHLGRWAWCLGKLGCHVDQPLHTEIILKSMDKLGTGAMGLPHADLSMFLCALPWMGMTLSKLSDEQRGALWRNFARTCDKQDPSNFAATVMSLSRIEATWSTLHGSAKKQIWDNFHRVAPLITRGRDAAQLLKAFGDMDINTKKLTDDDLDVIFAVAMLGINRKGDLPQRTCQQMAMTFQGMSKLGLQRANLTIELIRHTESCLLKYHNQFSDREVANVLYSLGKMSWSWASLPVGLRTALQAVVLKTLPAMTAQGMFLTVNGMALMDVQWGALQADLQMAIEQKLNSTLSPDLIQNPHALVQTNILMKSLSKMKASIAPPASIPEALETHQQSKLLGQLFLARDAGTEDEMDAFVMKYLKEYADTKPEMTETLLSLLESVSDRITRRHLGRWMWSLGRLGCKAGTPRHDALLSNAMQKLCSVALAPENVPMFLNGLDQAFVKASHFTTEQHKALMQTLARSASFFRHSDISAVLMELGKLGITWSSMPVETEQALWKSFRDNAPRLVEQRHAAQAVKSLGQLGLDASALIGADLQAIYQVAKRGINRINQQGDVQRACQHTSMTLLGLGKMGLLHSKLHGDLTAWTEECLLQIMPHFDEQGVSNVLYALGLLQWLLSADLQDAFQKQAVAKIAPMRPQELALMLFGWSYVMKWDQLLPNLKTAILIAVRNALIPKKAMGGTVLALHPDVIRHMPTCVSSLERMECGAAVLEAVEDAKRDAADIIAVGIVKHSAPLVKRK